MAATTKRTRTWFRPPKIRLHRRLCLENRYDICGTNWLLCGTIWLGRIPLKRMKENEGNTCMLLRCAIETDTIDRAMVPKTRKRSTQNSNTEHPKLENKASKTRKRSIQNSKTKHPKLETSVRWRTTTLSLAWCKPNQVEAMDASAPPKVHQSIPRSIWFLACRGRAVSIFSWAFLSCHPFVYVSLC